MVASATVRPFASSEWATFRELRLRALEESPDSFGSTLAMEGSLPLENWSRHLAATAKSGSDLPLIAEAGGTPAGLTWAKVDASDAALVNVNQMWVAPEFRGRGLGRMLLRAALEWARGRKANRVHLSVACGNSPAMQLYVSEGFKPSGQSEPLRPGSTLLVQPMRLLLNEGAV
jgi:GNAT superfamily N-acetyltransferase